MPGWVKATLIIVGILVVCYALNISPAGVLSGLIHGIQQMHQQSVNGR